MKKLLISLVTMLLLSSNVYAASVSSNLDYSTCMSFADGYKTILSSEKTYDYKYCYRATCSNGTYYVINMTSNSAFKCGNGNGDPKITSGGDGCSSYTGTCSTSKTTYCTKIVKVDCTLKSNGTSYEVAKTKPTLYFASPSITKEYGSSSFTNKLTTNSTGTITYKSSNTKVATVSSSGKVTIKGVGKATITASLSSTSTYESATKSYSLEVTSKPSTNKKKPTLSFASSSITKEYGSSSFTNKLTTNSTGTITYKSSNTKVATVSSSGKVTIKGVGKTTITASLSSTSTYESATKSYSLEVKSKKTQDTKTTNSTKETSVVASTNTTTTTATTTTTTTELSGNTNIRSIMINEKNLDYQKDINEYSIRIPSSIKTLDIDVELEDETSKYTILGNNDLQDGSAIKIVVTAANNNELTVTLNISVSLSETESDCSLESIQIKNYKLDFNPELKEYSLKIKNEDKLDISVVPTLSSSTYEIVGNKDLKNGSSLVINVTSTDQTKCTYKINIVKKGNILKVGIIIALMLIAFVVTILLMIKQLKKAKGNYKYE